nr:hypothetical protein [Tanacetum cinerariifolium]
AFSASASVPSIYIQLFWNTLTYGAKTGAYSFQLDETLVLDANLLRDAIEITPIDQAHQFGSPSSANAIMDFMNELGYSKVIHFVSRMVTQIPSSQDALGYNYNPTKKGRKDKPRVIPYCWFMKLVMCHLGRIHNIHQRSTSLFHLAEEDLKLAPAPKPKATKEKPTKPSLAKPSKMGKVLKTHKGKSSFQFIDKEEPSQPKPEPEPKHQGEGEQKIIELDQGQAGSDPDKTPESRPPPEQEFIEEDQVGPDPKVSRVALAGPNPEPTHEEFMANVYLNVHFLNDKSTKDEPGKLNMDSEVVSMVTVPIHQASSSVPLLSTPIIDLYPPKPHMSQHLNRNSLLLSKRERLLIIQLRILDPGFSPWSFEICLTRDQTVNTVVKEAIHIALQALLRDCFRVLPEADMKEILQQRMFESGSYKSLPEHVALYEALEASMKRANRDEFLAKKDKSCKRRHDDQDPPPPLSDSDPNNKRRHDSGASDSEDTTHLPKLKTRPDWMKLVPKEDIPATPEPDWVILPNELSEPEND